MKENKKKDCMIYEGYLDIRVYQLRVNILYCVDFFVVYVIIGRDCYLRKFYVLRVLVLVLLS